MQPTIRIDEDVYGALKDQAEPFVDTPNDVLRRVLRLDDDQRAGEEPVLVAPTRPDRRPTKKRAPATKKKMKRTRVPAGSLLPESEYEIPLLETLVELGGAAPTAKALEQLGHKLDGRLTSLDKEAYGRSGYVRWKNRAQFVRDRLVKSGQLAKDSPRGTWEITDAGRERLMNREEVDQ